MNGGTRTSWLGGRQTVSAADHDAARPEAMPLLRPQAASVRDDRRSSPPAAIKLLLPVWGHRFVSQFLDRSLPTVLAPGNLPALTSMLPCEFIVLTSGADEAFIRRHPTFRALCEICTTKVRLIDHLITCTNYSTTLTLAYTEAVRVSGPAMLDTCFLLILSDYIMADGSLAHVMVRMMQGASGVLVGNFQVAAESALPWLQAKLRRAAPALAVPPREMMRWGLAHLHPITVANTVNFPLNHNRHTNRMFWRAKGETLVGRFYLMHPIVVRPETMDFVIGASCDYSFIPEMCPSGNVDVITDSDEYLVVEMQSSGHEANLLRAGPLRPRALARTLSEWTTQQHRQNVHHSIIFHAGNLPEELDATIATADRFIAQVERSMRRGPKPHRDHPYWISALASHREATGQRLSTIEQWLALRLPYRLLTTVVDPVGKRFVERVVDLAFGRPPLLRPWHPRRVDHDAVVKHLRQVICDPQQRLLMIANRPTVFTVSFADDNKGVRLRLGSFLGGRAKTETLRCSFDVCLVELDEPELVRGDQIIDQVVPLMKPNGRIVMVAYNRRRKDAAGFGISIGLAATRFMRAGVTLDDVRVVPASRFRWLVSRVIVRVALAAYYRPWIGVPLLACSGGLLLLCSLLANAVARESDAGALRPGRLVSSVHMILNMDQGGRDFRRDTAPPISCHSLRDDTVRASVLVRPVDAPSIRGTSSPRESRA